MFGLSRRGLLTGLAYAAARPAAGAGAPQSSHADPLLRHYTSVQAFGAKGNGVADDTRAIRAAIAAAPPGGTVWFPPGTYNVSKTLELRPGTTYRGSNPQSSVIRQANGANLVAVFADQNFLQNRLQTTSGVQIEDLGIDGNAGPAHRPHNKSGHGIVLMTDRCLVRHVNVSNTPQAGIVLTAQNASGTIVNDNAVENRIADCTIDSPGLYGVWIRDAQTPKHHSNNLGRQTDGYLLNNIVKDCNGAWAMRIDRAAGWFIANNHVYHCAGNGIYMDHVAGTYFYCNEVDKFGLTESPPGSYYGVLCHFVMGRFRPSIFIGNVCATYEGKFPKNLYTYYEFDSDQYGQSNVVLVGNVTHNDPFGPPGKTPTASSAYESTAFTYKTQPGGTLGVSKAANANAGALTFESVPSDAHVQFGAPPPRTPITSALVGGVAGGAAVGGIGMAARSRQAREQVTKLLGSDRPDSRGRSKAPKARIDVIETLSRWEIDPLDFAPAAGTIHLTYFVPFQDVEVTQITSATGNRAAAGATLCRVGVYEVLEDGGLELLGATRNGAGRFWVVPHSITTVDLTPQLGPLPLLLEAGKPYAYGEIQVGGSPATRVGKVGNPALMALEPRGSASYPGYWDLPSSLPPPSEANASGLQLYARLTGGGPAGHDKHDSSLTGPAHPRLEHDHA
jgi:Pectate lyase superfamily protein